MATRFSKSASKRIVTAVLKIERMSDGDANARNRSSGYAAQIARAQVTTAIPTGTWASPSSTGRAQIRVKDAAGTWVDDGSPVVVWNDHTISASVAVAKVVKLALIAGEYWLTAADC
jgi:hypothetical protein